MIQVLVIGGIVLSGVAGVKLVYWMFPETGPKRPKWLWDKTIHKD